MFKKQNGMAKAPEFDGNSTNRIVPGTKIKGDVITEGDIRIDGELEGTLVCKGKLVVGQSGKVKGEVTCQNANVSGNLEGTFKASEVLAVQSTGNVSGEIVYGKLSVEMGAKVIGNLSISNGATTKQVQKETKVG